MRYQSRLFRAVALPCALSLMLIYSQRTTEAQTEFVRGSYFPAELEFRELESVRSDQTLEDPASLAAIEGGQILLDVGCQRYAKREYGLRDGGFLSIEVATLKDPKASYSVLTLLRSSPLEDGPPGQFRAATPGGLLLAQGNLWVRIRSADPDLCRRIGVSVSNRIGQRESALPALMKRLPGNGLMPGSVRFFLGPYSFRTHGEQPRGFQLKVTSDLEVVQAQYELADKSGNLSLVSFPTNQVAQDYFDSLSGPPSRAIGATGIRTFARRAGPLVAILEGTFEPEQADKILGSLEFQYSIRWIYDKNNRSSATVWGVPVSLLGTVVRSLVLVALLCAASIFVGFGIAVFRILLRGYAPNNILDRPERTEMIRLKLNEN